MLGLGEWRTGASGRISKGLEKGGRGLSVAPRLVFLAPIVRPLDVGGSRLSRCAPYWLSLRVERSLAIVVKAASRAELEGDLK